MTTSSTAILKSSSPSAKDVFSAVTGVVDNVEKLNKAFGKKDPKNINKLLTILDQANLAKLSSSLGMIGCVWGFVSLFSSQKSSAEIIMDMIGDVSDQIETLQNLMLAKFDHMETLIKKEAIPVPYRQEVSKIEAAMKSVSQFINAKTQADREVKAENLLTYDTSKLRDAAMFINGLLQQEGPLNPNVYSRNLESDYGDPNVINQIGATITSHLSSALMAESFIKVIKQLDKEGVLFSYKIEPGRNVFDDIPESKRDILVAIQSDNADYYSDFIQKNGEVWSDSLKACIDNHKMYVEKFIDAGELQKIDTSDHKSSVEKLVKTLSERWSYLDHFAIIYNPLAGDKKHAIRGLNTNLIKRFRYKVKDKKVNILIAWVDKDETKKTADTLNSNVSHQYKKREYRPGYMSGPVKVDVPATYDGPAEQFVDWKDLNDVCKDLKDNKPNKDRLVFVCRKNEAVSRAQTNPDRVLWKNGKHLDFAIFE